jgi:hypothetical protein
MAVYVGFMVDGVTLCHVFQQVFQFHHTNYNFLQYSTPTFVGSTPDGAIGIFHWLNLSGHTVALGSTQPLTEMSTRNTSWEVKVAGV